MNNEKSDIEILDIGNRTKKFMASVYHLVYHLFVLVVAKGTW